MSDEATPVVSEKTERELLLEKIVPPHTVRSVEVTENMIDIVVKDGQTMLDICFSGNGIYPSAYAVAHSQIEEKKPLRFFAHRNGMLVCNPVITRKTSHPVDSEEGCITYGYHTMINVPRSHKIEVDFQTIIDDDDGKKTLSSVFHESLSGRDAKIFQHEIDHMDGTYIYEGSNTPQK